MKKILFLIETLQGGGAEKVLADITKNIDKNKYEITVMKMYEGDFYRKDIEKNAKFRNFTFCFEEKNHSYIKKFLLKFRGLIYRLPANIQYRLFIREKYDIEIAFLEGAAVKIIANSSNRKSRKYTWVHVDLEKQHWSKQYFKNLEQEIKAYKVFDKCFCVSDTTREAFERRMQNTNAQTLYNPVDEVNIVNLSLEEINNWEKKKFTIITAGRLKEQKGYDRLLEVHNKLINKGYDYELLILGDGEKKKEIQKYINENNLSKTVKLLGFQSNPYKYMAKADLFVCSSRVEGYSLVVAESLVLKIPVVSTFCSGPVELLDYGKYGLVVENNEEAIYQGLKKILDDKNLYEHYKKQARIRARDFKIEQRITEIEEIFDQES